MSKRDNEDGLNSPSKKRRKFFIVKNSDYKDPTKSKKYKEFQSRCPEEFKPSYKNKIDTDWILPINTKPEPNQRHIYESVLGTSNISAAEQEIFVRYKNNYKATQSCENVLNEAGDPTEDVSVKSVIKNKRQIKRKIWSITDDNNNDADDDNHDHDVDDHDELIHCEEKTDDPTSTETKPATTEVLRDDGANDALAEIQNENETIVQVIEVKHPTLPRVEMPSNHESPTIQKPFKQPNEEIYSPPVLSIHEVAKLFRENAENKCGDSKRRYRKKVNKVVDENSPMSDSNMSQAQIYIMRVTKRSNEKRTRKTAVLANNTGNTNTLVCNPPKSKGFQPSKVNFAMSILNSKQKRGKSLEDFSKPKTSVQKETMNTVINKPLTLPKKVMSIKNNNNQQFVAKNNELNPNDEIVQVEKRLTISKVAKEKRLINHHHEVTPITKEKATSIPTDELPPPAPVQENDNLLQSTESYNAFNSPINRGSPVTVNHPQRSILSISDELRDDQDKVSRPQMQICKTPHKIGFSNNGNTCYINASLQSLLGLIEFISAVEKWSSNYVSWNDSCMLQALLDVYNSRKNHIDLVDETVKKLGENFCKYIYTTFIPGNQQDAGEFLNKLINQFEKEENNTNIVNIYFHLTYRDVFTCDKCGCQESAEREDLMLYVPVREEKCSIQDLIYNQKGTCPKCQQDAPYQFVFKKLPEHLILNLGRYKMGDIGYGAEKIDTPFEISKSIKVKCQADENDRNACNTDSSEATYKLTSFVIHKGIFLNSGHYTAKVRYTVKNKPPTWYEYDDKVTCKTSITAEDEANCYILFYTKVKTTSSPEQVKPNSNTESHVEQELLTPGKITSTNVEPVIQSTTEVQHKSPMNETIEQELEDANSNEAESEEKSVEISERQSKNNSLAENDHEPKLDDGKLEINETKIQDKKLETKAQQNVEKFDETVQLQNENNLESPNEPISKLGSTENIPQLISEDQTTEISDKSRVSLESKTSDSDMVLDSSQEENDDVLNTTVIENPTCNFKSLQPNLSTTDYQPNTDDSECVSDMEDFIKTNSKLQEPQILNETYMNQSTTDDQTNLQENDSDMEIESVGECIAISGVKSIDKEDKDLYESWCEDNFEDSNLTKEMESAKIEEFHGETASKSVTSDVEATQENLQEESEMHESAKEEEEEGDEAFMLEDDENE